MSDAQIDQKRLDGVNSGKALADQDPEVRAELLELCQRFPGEIFTGKTRSNGGRWSSATFRSRVCIERGSK